MRKDFRDWATFSPAGVNKADSEKRLPGDARRPRGPGLDRRWGLGRGVAFARDPPRREALRGPTGLTPTSLRLVMAQEGRSPFQPFSFQFMKMRADGKALLAHGQRETALQLPAGGGRVGSSSGSGHPAVGEPGPRPGSLRNLQRLKEL